MTTFTVHFTVANAKGWKNRSRKIKARDVNEAKAKTAARISGAFNLWVTQ